jgi:hypothetical protein
MDSPDIKIALKEKLTMLKNLEELENDSAFGDDLSYVQDKQSPKNIILIV